MSELSSSFGERVAALLKDGEDLRRQLLLPDPTPGSAASHDLATASRQLGSSEPVERVISLVDLWTLLEAEHLRGMGVLIEDGTTVFPIFPLLRAVLEHAAWVCWLLDPDAGSRGRAVRAALAHLRSDQEIVGVAKRWGGSSTSAYRDAKSRLQLTRNSIVRDFGNLDTQTSTIDNETIASPTQVVEHFGACEGNARVWRGTYDYLCGTANHPSQNAFEFVERDGGRAYLTLTNDFVNRMARIGLAAFLHSLAHLADYLGWPRDAMREYQRRVNDVLGADPPGA